MSILDTDMFGRKLVYKGKSEFGSYKIFDQMYNGRKARVLYGDHNTPQSGAALDDDPELLFNYNQRFLEIVQSIQPKRILVIGGGVMMLPIAAYRQFPKLIIDVVEIDGLLIDMAKQYFNAPGNNRLQTFIQDGVTYLQSTAEKYDVIIIDAFTGFTIPAHLLEYEAVQYYQNHLNDGGVVAMNVISRWNDRPSLAKEVVATLRELFQEVAVFQADHEQPMKDEQNLVIVTSNRMPELDYVQSIDIS